MNCSHFLISQHSKMSNLGESTNALGVVHICHCISALIHSNTYGQTQLELRAKHLPSFTYVNAVVTLLMATIFCCYAHTHSRPMLRVLCCASFLNTFVFSQSYINFFIHIRVFRFHLSTISPHKRLV